MAVATLQKLFDDSNAHADEICGAKIEFKNTKNLPREATDGYLEVPTWLRVEGVACSFVDMVGSSKIDQLVPAATVCKVYEAFVGNLVRIWKYFDVAYFDVQGDGGFALFDGELACVRAFLAAETFRSWVHQYLNDKIAKVTKSEFAVRSRSSIHFGTVDAKRIGTRGDMNHNFVWLNSTTNTAAKLLTFGDRGAEEMVVSEAAYKELSVSELITHSCGCSTSGKGPKRALWTEQEHQDLPGIARSYHLQSMWCPTHGSDYMAEILKSQEKKAA